MNELLDIIRDANPERSFDSMARRLLKLTEEVGEASEAYLVVTTTGYTRKVKTYADLREELVDACIVALDCALTPMPNEDGMSQEDIEADVMATLNRKVAKWLEQKNKK